MIPPIPAANPHTSPQSHTPHSLPLPPHSPRPRPQTDTDTDTNLFGVIAPQRVCFRDLSQAGALCCGGGLVQLLLQPSDLGGGAGVGGIETLRARGGG